MTYRNTDKLTEICKALVDQTREGRLAWRETEDPKAFEVSFPDYSVRIVFHADTNPDSYTSSPWYSLEIYDNAGRLIETAAGHEIGNDKGTNGIGDFPRDLEELYGLARRKALGTDRALDDLLSRLSVNNG